jgi:hypothetical protein
MTTEPTILDIVASFMADIPTRVRPELHVAEPVWRFLLDRYVPLIPRGATSRLMEMPVVIDDDLTGGQWQIRENGEVSSSGDMAPAPEGMTVSYSPISGWIAIRSDLLQEWSR